MGRLEIRDGGTGVQFLISHFLFLCLNMVEKGIPYELQNIIYTKSCHPLTAVGLGPGDPELEITHGQGPARDRGRRCDLVPAQPRRRHQPGVVDRPPRARPGPPADRRAGAADDPRPRSAGAGVGVPPTESSRRACKQVRAAPTCCWATRCSMARSSVSGASWPALPADRRRDHPWHHLVCSRSGAGRHPARHH